jgi:hypothetical protein
MLEKIVELYNSNGGDCVVGIGEFSDIHFVVKEYKLEGYNNVISINIRSNRKHGHTSDDDFSIYYSKDLKKLINPEDVNIHVGLDKTKTHQMNLANGECVPISDMKSFFTEMSKFFNSL